MWNLSRSSSFLYRQNGELHSIVFMVLFGSVSTQLSLFSGPDPVWGVGDKDMIRTQVWPWEAPSLRLGCVEWETDRQDGHCNTVWLSASIKRWGKMVAQIRVNQRRRIYRETFCMSQAKKRGKSVIGQRDGKKANVCRWEALVCVCVYFGAGRHYHQIEISCFTFEIETRGGWS